MTKPSYKPAEPYSLDGIEVVELWEVDLDFAVEEAFRQGTPQVPETTRVEPATPKELRALDLFQGLDGQDIAKLAAQCRTIHAVPGYVLLAPGRLNTKLYVVVEGQLRLYARTGDKRPIAVVDIGQSTGLRSALTGRPVDHSLIATEVSQLLAIDLAVLDELAKRSHTFARKYAELLATYVRGDNCLNVGARTRAGEREGHIDALTLLHNQHWLDTVFPRLVGRYRMGDKKLAVAAFAIDKLEHVVKQKGVGAGMRVLEGIGPRLLDQTRPTDIVAINRNRHFFVFLPNCDLDAARQLATRLKAVIPRISLLIGSDSASETISVTLSLGIATLESGMNEVEFLNKTEALIRKSVELGGDALSETL